MSAVLHAFPDERAPAERLAGALGAPLSFVETHRFPDGEILPRAPHAARTAVVYRSLNRPDEKLIELLLAADALRRNGAHRLVLIAPYLCYMRQDTVFSPGEPISQRVIAGILDGVFDRIVTVDPHLHRTSRLSDLFHKSECTHLHGADALVPFLRGAPLPPNLVVVGPDAESEPWVRRIADPLGLEHVMMTKHRRGDVEIELTTPAPLNLTGRPALIVDDICSSGATLCSAIRSVKAAGATTISVFVTHALCNENVVNEMRAAGAGSVMSTDSCAHSTNQVALAGLLAGSLISER